MEDRRTSTARTRTASSLLLRIAYLTGTRSSTRILAALSAVLLLIGSCVHGDAPLGPEGLPGLSVSLPLQATLIPSAGDSAARPVNRIRASAERVPDGVVLATTVLDVSPSDDSWEVSLEVPLAGPQVQVVVVGPDQVRATVVGTAIQGHVPDQLGELTVRDYLGQVRPQRLTDLALHLVCACHQLLK